MEKKESEHIYTKYIIVLFNLVDYKNLHIIMFDCIKSWLVSIYSPYFTRLFIYPEFYAKKWRTQVSKFPYVVKLYLLKIAIGLHYTLIADSLYIFNYF